ALGVELATAVAAGVVDIAGIAQIERQAAEFRADAGVETDLEIVSRIAGGKVAIDSRGPDAGIEDAVGRLDIGLQCRTVRLVDAARDVAGGDRRAEGDIEFGGDFVLRETL